MRKKLRRLHLPKETLLLLSGDEATMAAGGLNTLACTKIPCSVGCATNTAKVGECCA